MLFSGASWHRVICNGTTLIDKKTTRITTQSKIKEWSAVVYINGCHQIPKHTTLDIMVTSKATAKKSGNKYWNADKLKMVVNRRLILELLKERLFWKADHVLQDFECKNKQDVLIEGDPYAYAWMKYIDKQIACGTTSITPGLLYVLSRLQIICMNIFVENFEKEIVNLGLPGEVSKKLVQLLDWDDTTDNRIDPGILAKEWTARAYSPYLQGVDDTVRRQLQHKGTSTEQEQIRYMAHRILEDIERNGTTYLSVGDMTARLKHKQLDFDLLVLEENDKYEKLRKNKVKYVRDPTIVIRDGYVQHLDVAEAEIGLVEYWKHTGTIDTNKPAEYSPYDISSLNTEQQTAFENIYKYRISCITGGPGRGKTWLSQRLCDSWQQRTGGKVLIVSSYHQPLKNLQTNMTGTDLSMPNRFATIASSAYTNSPLFCTCTMPTAPHSGPVHAPNLLIIEEAGVCTMVDLFSIYKRVLKRPGECVRQGPTTIVMVGDDKQLKPIGAGQPFAEFIRFYPGMTTRLTRNMRTNAPNLRYNIQSICDGAIDIRTGTDFVWHRDVPNITAANYDQICKMFFQSYLHEFNLNTDVIIVHKNETRKLLNRLLHDKHLSMLVRQNYVKQNQVARIVAAPSFSSARFVKGTRVICKKTSDCKKATNGTRGIVQRLCANDSVEIQYADGTTWTTLCKWWELGYSLTAHKAQGSEYDSPYVYTFNDYFVSKDWLYTAVSRAKQRVVYMVPNAQHHAAIKLHPVQASLSRMAALHKQYQQFPIVQCTKRQRVH